MASGNHVAKVQTALRLLDLAQLDAADLSGKCYGRSTAAAVLSFKNKRGIINHAYQSKADDIVGKMTVAAMDKEMLDRENDPRLDTDEVCCNGDPAGDGLRHAVTHRLRQQFQDLPPGAGFARFRPGASSGLVDVSSVSFGLQSHFSRSVSNSLLGRDWKLDHVPAVGDPTHIVQIGKNHRLFTGERQRRVARQ